MVFHICAENVTNSGLSAFSRKNKEKIVRPSGWVMEPSSSGSATNEHYIQKISSS